MSPKYGWFKNIHTPLSWCFPAYIPSHWIGTSRDGMLGNFLMIGSRLINIESVSPYPIHHVRYVSLSYHTCIYDPSDVPKRQSTCWRLAS